MSILLNLSEEGYKLLRRDYAVLVKDTMMLQLELNNKYNLKDEIKDALNQLEPFYEPKVEVFERDEKYVGLLKFFFPVSDVIEFEVGNISDFNGIEDENLKKLANQEALNKIKSKYPNYF